MTSGIIQCAKYSYAPNKLGYCGPNKNRDLFEYCQKQTIDAGLNNILEKFQTLHPYLSFIACENQLKNPFLEKVVEAYWLGNNLLDNISLNKFYRHLIDGQQLKKKLNKKLLNLVFGNFKKPATAHHNFHVFNIWQRTGYLAESHTLETMDKCRISWGQILAVKPEGYQIKYQPLVYKAISGRPRLALVAPVKKTVVRGFVLDGQPGDWLSLHWQWPCEKLTIPQLTNLKKYTRQMLSLAH